jgi:inositol phosphorylceramide mannosyltransferase catalytic subunit
MKVKTASRIRRLLWSMEHPTFVPIATYLATRKFRKSATLAPEDEKQYASFYTYQSFQEQLVEQTSGGVSKIIFQTIKTRENMPLNYRYWRSSFVKHNPDFKCLLWDDEDNDQFIASEFSWFLQAFRDFPSGIFRADAIRPFFLFRYGGFYADMDTECLSPLTEQQTTGDVILGRMGVDETFCHSIPNAIMASKPYELFWLLFIAMMIEKIAATGDPARVKEAGPEEITGPVLLREVWAFYTQKPQDQVYSRAKPVIDNLSEDVRAKIHSGKVELLDSEIWYPLDWTNPLHRKLRAYMQDNRHLIKSKTAQALFPNASMITYWTHSWS